MKFPVAAALVLAALCTSPVRAADVGVSVQISQPGVHGRIDIGRFPQPALVLPQPVLVQQPAYAAPVRPVYMWVPPGHQKKWDKHCHKYHACGVPVYFVQEGWYQQHVMAPRGDQRRHEAHDRHGRHGDDHPGQGHGHGKHRD